MDNIETKPVPMPRSEIQMNYDSEDVAPSRTRRNGVIAINGTPHRRGHNRTGSIVYNDALNTLPDALQQKILDNAATPAQVKKEAYRFIINGGPIDEIDDNGGFVIDSKETIDEVNSQGATADEVNSQGATADEVNSQGATADEVNSQGATADEVNSQGATADEVNSQGATTDEVDYEEEITDDVDFQRATAVVHSVPISCSNITKDINIIYGFLNIESKVRYYLHEHKDDVFMSEFMPMVVQHLRLMTAQTASFKSVDQLCQKVNSMQSQLSHDSRNQRQQLELLDDFKKKIDNLRDEVRNIKEDVKFINMKLNELDDDITSEHENNTEIFEDNCEIKWNQHNIHRRLNRILDELDNHYKYTKTLSDSVNVALPISDIKPSDKIVVHEEIENANKDDMALFEKIRDVIDSPASEKLDGKLVVKIPNYFDLKENASTDSSQKSLYSKAFCTYEGYKMCLHIFPNGDGVGETTHMSVYLKILKSPDDAKLTWPFNKEVVLKLLSQKNKCDDYSKSFTPDPKKKAYQQPTELYNVADGCIKFVKNSIITNVNYDYLLNGNLYICVTVGHY